MLEPVGPTAQQCSFLHQSCKVSRDNTASVSSFGDGCLTVNSNQLLLPPFLLQAHQERGAYSVAPDETVHIAPVVKTYDKPTQVPPPQGVATNTQVPEVQEGPPSPLSEASSGYFSHSVSTATLSDALALGLDATAQASGQVSGSPPPVPCQAGPEAEPPLSSAAPGADSALPAPLQGESGLRPGPVPAQQTVRSAQAGGAASSEKQNEGAATSPPRLPASASQKESPLPQCGGDLSPATKPLGGPKDQAKPVISLEPDVSKPQLPPDLLSQSPAPASPFRIRKVRTSELKSFTRMLGGDPGCPSGATEDPLASGGPGDGSSGGQGQALEKLEVSSDSEEASEVPEWLREGEHVTVGTNKVGIVRYIGPTDFQEGTWVGVELDSPSGERGWLGTGSWHWTCSLPSGGKEPAPPVVLPKACCVALDVSGDLSESLSRHFSKSEIFIR